MMENDKKLRLQEVYGEFRFMASKFFRERNVSHDEIIYILSGYMHTLTNYKLEDNQKET